MEYLLELDDFDKGLSAREIPIGSIVIVEDAYPRMQVNKKRVEMFRELFRIDAAKVPPIRVAPLLGGDNETQYVFLDGRHRLMGRQSSSGSIQAHVLPDIAFSRTELETPEAKRRIRLVASLCNSKHGLQFSRKEIRRNIIELYLMKTSLRELYLLAPERTVRHYLKEIRSEERKEREKMKAKVLELRAAGYTQKRAAYEVGTTQGTISKIESSLRQGGKRAGEQIFRRAALPDGMTAPAGPTAEDRTGKGGPDEASRCSGSVTGDFEAIYNTLMKMNSSKKLESLVKQYLIPLLAGKFQAVQELIQNAGYATENELLSRERKCLVRQMADMNRKNREIRSEKERLHSELAARKNYCSWQCSFSRERYMREQRNYLDSLLEDAEDLGLYIRLVDSAGALLSDGTDISHVLSGLRDLLAGKKYRRRDFREGVEHYLRNASGPERSSSAATPDFSPETRDFVRHALAITKQILSKVATDTAYKFLSTFDYCVQVKHPGGELGERLSRFADSIRNPDIFTEDLGKRIEEYRSALTEDLVQCI